MNRLMTAFITAAIFVALGVAGAFIWHFIELATGYTATLFAMAGY